MISDLTERDLRRRTFAKIEAEMAKIVKQGQRAVRAGGGTAGEGRRALPRPEARTLKVEQHRRPGWADQDTKCRSIARASSSTCVAGRTFPYAQRAIGAFKLLSVAGAYWKGDASGQPAVAACSTAPPGSDKQDSGRTYIDETGGGQAAGPPRAGQAAGAVCDRSDASAPGLVLWLPKGGDRFASDARRLHSYTTS